MPPRHGHPIKKGENKPRRDGHHAVDQVGFDKAGLDHAAVLEPVLVQHPGLGLLVELAKETDVGRLVAPCLQTT